MVTDPVIWLFPNQVFSEAHEDRFWVLSVAVFMQQYGQAVQLQEQSRVVCKPEAITGSFLALTVAQIWGV